MPKTSPKAHKPSSSENCTNCPVASNCPAAGATLGGVPISITSSEEPLSFTKGQEVFLAGAEFKCLYVIQTGSVKLYSISKQGDEQITSFHAAGEIIGLDGITSGVHLAFAQALEPTTVCCLNLDKVLKTSIGREFKFSQTLLKLLSRELYAREEHIMVIAKLTAEQRVADFICKQSDRLLALHRSGTELRLPMTRYEIGNYLALTVETVSRIFTLLQSKGIISVNGRYVQIIDPEALAKIITATTTLRLANTNK